MGPTDDSEGNIRREHITVDVDGTLVGQDVFVHEETGLDVNDNNGTLRTREETETLIRDVYRVGRDSLGSELVRYEKWMRQGDERGGGRNSSKAVTSLGPAVPRGGSRSLTSGRPSTTTSSLPWSQQSGGSSSSESASTTSSWEDRIASAETWKRDGNARLSAGDARQAARHYTRGLKELFASYAEQHIPTKSDLESLQVDWAEVLAESLLTLTSASSAQLLSADITKLAVSMLANRGQAQLTLQHWANCAHSCNVVLAIDPHHVKSWYRLGVCYARLGKVRALVNDVLAHLVNQQHDDDREQSSAITQSKGEALSQLQQATKEFLPEVLWMSLFKSSLSSSHVGNRDVGCHLIHIRDMIDPTKFRHRRVAAATLRYDVNKGETVAVLPVMRVPWGAWFRLPDSAAAAALSDTFVDLGNKKPSLLHPTTEFVKAFLVDEGKVRSALTAYLSMTGRCPYPRSSRRNIAILSALRETMDLYLPTAVAATDQQQRATETQRSQLFPVLVTAACVLGMIELASDDECMQVHSSPFLQCKPDDTTSNDQPPLLVATTTSHQLVALGTGHFTDFLRDDDEESWRMNSPDAEVWEVNCSIDTTTGVVTALCDLNAGDVCTYK